MQNILSISMKKIGKISLKRKVCSDTSQKKNSTKLNTYSLFPSVPSSSLFFLRLFHAGDGSLMDGARKKPIY